MLYMPAWNGLVEGPTWDDAGDLTLRQQQIFKLSQKQIQPRLIGHGPATVGVERLFHRGQNEHPCGPPQPFAPDLALSNAWLNVTFKSSDATLTVLDRRTSRRWSQQAFTPDVTVLDAEGSPDQIAVKLLHSGSGCVCRRDLS